MTPLRRRMTEDMILRNLAPGTIRQYVNCVAGFAPHFNTSPSASGPNRSARTCSTSSKSITSPGATTAKFALPCSSSTA